MALDAVQIAERLAKIEHTLAIFGERLDKNDTLTQMIYEMMSTLKLLAEQNKGQNERIERIEAGQKSQGERIGALEKEPGHRWKSLVSQIITLATAAIVAGIVSKLGG